MPKGFCSKKQIVYGVVTVSEKGQISIPVDLRNVLNIQQGEQLMVLKRKDESGFALVKLSKIDELMYKIQDNENFFQK
ncbi:MAG: AbrB/MazE/SpoVT family DNA-binding domain-containing protein [bacterium]